MSPRILVVEDSRTQAEELRLILESEGFAVEVARDGRAGLARLDDGGIDLVLSDVVMPDLSGYELCREIKIDPRMKHIPVVLLTQLNDPLDILQGLECGADNFITKPFDANHLIRRVRDILANRAMPSMPEPGTVLNFRGRGVTVTTHKGQILDLLLATVEDYVLARLRERAARHSKEEAQRQAAALAEVNRHKDDFLAMLAHELRNPLASLLPSLHALRRATTPSRDRDESLDRMERQLRHLNRLVDDLLDVARLVRGTAPIRPERLDLARLVRTTVEDRRPLVEQAGLTATVQTPETPVWVQGDPTRLVQALDNLLDNAVKFSAGGGRVEVSLHTDDAGRQAVITVRDQGIGIDAEILPRLFTTFAQADRSLDRPRGGLGLGLAVVKELVDLHGGQVEAASAGPGGGATFTIRLPLQREPEALTVVPKGPSAACVRRRILVVEDSRDAAESLRLLLEMLGHEVQVAGTGPEGVQAAANWLPEVVVSDIGLPGLDGYEVARRIRRLPGMQNALLVALTGYGSDEDRMRSRQAGFNHHLVKPADPLDLLHLLAGRRG
jgi:signal transduction histidine kinase